MDELSLEGTDIVQKIKTKRSDYIDGAKQELTMINRQIDSLKARKEEIQANIDKFK